MIRNYDSNMPEEVNKYFRRLVGMVGVDIESEPDLSYLLLMRALFKKEFYWTLEFDEHRAMDGITLREELFDSKMELGPCSVLEMLAALAKRCDDLLWDGRDRTDVWFWDMIENLGLDSFVDSNFDSMSVDLILNKWMDRDYDQNGSGGLFYCGNSERDMRKLEIWEQMQAYIMNIFDEK